MSGRVVLITGASTGIGLVTAAELARRGAEVVIACRPGAKADAALAHLRKASPAAVIDLLPLDLGDLASVRACAAAFLSRATPLHVLVNNAGLAGGQGLTKDGFELTFGVNHLGPFLLTELLLGALRSGAPSRVVNVSSRAHRRADAIDFASLRRPTASRTGVAEYGVSKLCNVLHARELARRLAGTGVTTYALHPGVVATEIWRRLPAPARWIMNRFMITPEQGAQTTLYCATAPELAGVTGRYYDRCQETAPTAVAQDDALAARLWQCSEAWANGRTPDAPV